MIDSYEVEFTICMVIAMAIFTGIAFIVERVKEKRELRRKEKELDIPTWLFEDRS